MTFEEALKILEKEVFGIRFKKFDKPLKFEEKLWIRNEKPEVLEALHIVAKNGIGVSVPETTLRIRRLIIKKMKAGEGEPTPVSGTPLSAVEGIKLKRKDNQNTSEKPALKESATQFNDALLDEQAKKIAELTKENERLERVSKTTTDEFNKLYYRMITKSDKIEALGKEIAKLNGIIHEKKKVCCELVAENTDLKEHLAESKESAKNFASLLSDAYDELRELKKKYADKVVDEINAQALKSAESALAWKEKVIAEKDMALAYYEKKIAEKDEVIDNLRKELKAQKGLVNHISKKYDGAKINLNLRMKECDKLEKELDEAKKQNTAVMVDMTAKCLRAARESINDVFESYAAKYVKSTLDDLKEKAYESFNAKACNLGLVGSKDGNGIFDQMVGVDNAEEGADLSGAIVLCGKDFIDAIKKMK